jgi:hypothetical protein
VDTPIPLNYTASVSAIPEKIQLVSLGYNSTLEIRFDIRLRLGDDLSSCRPVWASLGIFLIDPFAAKNDCFPIRFGPTLLRRNEGNGIVR